MPAIEEVQGPPLWIVKLSRAGPVKPDCASLPPDWRTEPLTPVQARIILQLPIAAGLYRIVSTIFTGEQSPLLRYVLTH